MVQRSSFLLDSNIWRYLVDARAVESVRKAAKVHDAAIVACPAVVYECLRVGDPLRRRAFAKALTHTEWLRPMPEAFVEAEELRAAINALRPEWLMSKPNLMAWTKNRSDWHGGFWRRVRTEPSRMSRIIADLGDGVLAAARKESVRRRDEARILRHTTSTLTLDNARAWYALPQPGWDGEPFEAWRGVSELRWWYDLIVTPRQTVLDWLGSWLDLRRLRDDRDGWVTFWTREVSKEQVPREWLRWAIAEVQSLRKTNAGTPVDNQITSYLADYDFFVTADRVFVDCIELIRQYSPIPLARISISPAGDDAVLHVLRLIETQS